jgi:hypothetical protein
MSSKKEQSEIIVVGRYHFYPVNETAKELVKVFDKKSFTKRILEVLEKYFIVTYT